MKLGQKALALALAALLLISAAGAVVAQSSANYNLEWHVIGGGGPVSSASYTVNSTIGQAASSPAYPASSHYAVSRGYWFGDGITIWYPIYLPIVVRAHSQDDTAPTSPRKLLAFGEISFCARSVLQ